jgi:hypothetical protein
MDVLLEKAQVHAPVFKVNAADVSFLSSPEQFYKKIHEKIESSRLKILISTLYVGTDELSVALVIFLGKVIELKSDPLL